jgi:hypothetical protein
MCGENVKSELNIQLGCVVSDTCEGCIVLRVHNYTLLGCDIYICGEVPAFLRSVVSVYQTTRHHIRMFGQLNSSRCRKAL